MLCTECQDHLSDFIDNEAAEPVRRSVAAHLAECGDCDTLRGDLATIVEASARLPRYAPSESVWTAIETEALGSRRPPSWFAKRFDFSVTARQVAAAAVLAVATGSVGMYALRSTGATAPAAGGFGDFTQTPIKAEALAATGDVSSLELAVGEMERALEPGKVAWSPELRSAFDTGLSKANARVEECRTAFRASEGMGAARERLESAYRDKLKFLEAFAQAGKR